MTLTSQLDETADRPSAEQTHGNFDLPKDIELNDDVRLNKIQFNEAVNLTELPSLEQTLCLLTV